MVEHKSSRQNVTSPEMEWFFRWFGPPIVLGSIFIIVLVLTSLYPETMEKLFGL